jgi:hypothetical protein
MTRTHSRPQPNAPVSAEARTSLPFDVSRCLGLGCARKVTCRRYLEWQTGGERTPVTGSLCDDTHDARIPA